MIQFDYDVFLSYRHRPLDREVTRRVFRFLESYRLPKELEGKGKHGVRRVFRDTEELPVSRILSNTIENALQNTRCLIVICSRDTPSSEWVDREVATFIELGKAEKIFPLLISGDPEISFPPSLKLIPDIGGRVMDVRTEEETASAVLKRASTALLKVIAEVAGCREEELVRADHLRRRRRILTTAFASTALFLFVAGVSGYLWQRAERDRMQTRVEQEASLSVLSKLTYGLPDRLSEQPGLYSQIAGILSENAEQIRRILSITPDSGRARIQMADNEQKLSTALSRIGEYRSAEEAGLRAVSIYEEISADGTGESFEMLASSRNNLGAVMTFEGRLTEACGIFGQALTDDLSAGGASVRPSILGNLGRAKFLLGQYDEAIDILRESVSSGEPADNAGRLTYAAARLNLGLALMQTGNYPEAEEELRISDDIYHKLVAEYGSRKDRTDALHARSALADCLTRQGRTEEAAGIFVPALEEAEIIAADPSNVEAQMIYGELCNNYGLSLNQTGHFAGADPFYRKYAEIQEKLYNAAATPQNAAALSQAWYNIAENSFKLGKYDAAEEFFRKSLDLYKTAAEELGSYHQSEYLSRLAFYDIIVERDYDKAAKTALEAYELQPDSFFVLCNLGYALLLSGNDADADTVFNALAGLGEGALQTVEQDFGAMQRAGISSPHMDEVIRNMKEILS